MTSYGKGAIPMASRFVYMDYNATTPLHPEVKEEMVADLEIYANASSMHEAGRRARSRVEKARASVARLVGARDPECLYFTSGGSESNNTVFNTMYDLGRRGTAGGSKPLPERRQKIITTAIEHPCVLNAAKRLEDEGFPVVFLGVDGQGRIDLSELERELDPSRSRGGPVLLVSVMAANNEIGTLHPIAAIGRLCKERGVLFHTDATQAAGRIELDVEAQQIDLLSMSAHKFYGPKGVGALYVRRSKPRVRLVAQMDGGGHERGNRSGTLNVPGIVGFGRAAEIMMKEGKAESARLLAMRERLRTKIQGALEEVHLNGSFEHRLPGNLNLSFAFVEGEAMMMAIKDVAVSSGSACTSASLEPSYVLRALGVGDELAHSSIRFGIGRFNTDEEIDYVAELVIAKVNKLRELSPLYEMFKEGIDLKTVAWTAH